MNRVFTALRALVYMTGFLGIWAWVALQARALDPHLGGSLPAWSPLLGWAVMALGGATALWCVLLFIVAGGGTPAPFDPPRAFVAAGPYRWVRNPMYLGAFGLLLGFALWGQSPAMLGVVPVAGGLAHLFVVLVEEPGLERRFGVDYVAYCRRVHRWWPRRPRQTPLEGGV